MKIGNPYTTYVEHFGFTSKQIQKLCEPQQDIPTGSWDFVFDGLNWRAACDKQLTNITPTPEVVDILNKAKRKYKALEHSMFYEGYNGKINGIPAAQVSSWNRKAWEDSRWKIYQLASNFI